MRVRSGIRPKWPISAYRVSAPVTARNTAPSITKPCHGAATSSAMPCQGSSARSTAGCCAMFHRPSSASTANHTSMIGPNSPPIAAVPRVCTRNRPVSSASEIGIDIRVEDRCRDLQPLDRAQHRNRRRDHAVAVEQRGADQSRRHDPRPQARLRLACCAAPARSAPAARPRRDCRRA